MTIYDDEHNEAFIYELYEMKRISVIEAIIIRPADALYNINLDRITAHSSSQALDQ